MDSTQHATSAELRCPTDRACRAAQEDENATHLNARDKQVTSDLVMEYLDAARLEALPERESSMFGLRYGLSGGGIHTLAEIGNEYGISRERVRQVLLRSHRRIIARARRQRRAGQTDLPCVELAFYLEDVIRPEETGSSVRLLQLIQSELAFLPYNSRFPEFIATLAYPSRDQAHAAAIGVQKERLQRSRKPAGSDPVDLRKPSEASTIERLLLQTAWPRQVRTLTGPQVQELKRRRDVSLTGDGNAGSFFSNKLGRYVQYESDLESRFLHKVETHDGIVAYQEQPLRIPYLARGRELTYYPDFLLISKDHRGIVVETKPVFHMALRENLVKFDALASFCMNQGLGLLITDGHTTIEQVRTYTSDGEYVRQVLSCLREGPIDWQCYKQIRDTYRPSEMDFAAMVLKHSLCWQLGPFLLSLHDSDALT